MATLEIRKKSNKVWQHVSSDLGTYIVSKLYCKTNGNTFKIVEHGGSRRGEYDYSDISVYDICGGAETFVTPLLLMQRLEQLGYVGFLYDGEVLPADLISTDASNNLIIGSDGKLFSDISGLVKKQFAQSVSYPLLSGANVSIPIPANGAWGMILTNPLLTSIACLDLSLMVEAPYIGKLFKITNETGNPLELKHLTGAGIQFITKNALSIIIPNKESVFVEYDGTNAKELFRSFVTTNQKLITANTTLDSTYNNCIVKVKGTATITIPTGLENNFNCVFDVWTGATATFAVSGGASVNATLGSTLAAGKMATLYQDAATNVYRLRGELS